MLQSSPTLLSRNPNSKANLMPIEALIFDCDGTLTDSMRAHYIAWRDALAACNMNLDETAFLHLLRHTVATRHPDAGRGTRDYFGL